MRKLTIVAGLVLTGASACGRSGTGGPPLHLHAREVVVPLYPKREAIRVVAPVPEAIRARLAACGWRGEEAVPDAAAAAFSTAAP